MHLLMGNLTCFLKSKYCLGFLSLFILILPSCKPISKKQKFAFLTYKRDEYKNLYHKSGLQFESLAQIKTQLPNFFKGRILLKGLKAVSFLDVLTKQIQDEKQFNVKSFIFTIHSFSLNHEDLYFSDAAYADKSDLGDAQLNLLACQIFYYQCWIKLEDFITLKRYGSNKISGFKPYVFNSELGINLFYGLSDTNFQKDHPFLNGIPFERVGMVSKIHVSNNELLNTCSPIYVFQDRDGETDSIFLNNDLTVK